MTAQTIQPGRRAATAASADTEATEAARTNRLPRNPAQRRKTKGPRALRKRARPHLLLAGLVAAAELSYAAGELTGQAAIVAAVVSSALLVVTLVAAIVGRRRGYAHTAWALACAGAAASWLAATTVAGVSWDATAVLTVVGYGLALPYWRRHRLADPPEALPELVIEPGTIARRWKENVGGTSKHGVLPGSYLTGRREIKAGERYLLQLVPGKHTYDDVVSNLRKIAGGLNLTADRLIIEPYRPESDDEAASESKLLLTVVTRPPIPKKGVTWPGPQVYQRGRTELGPYVDGEGAGFWRTYTQDSMWGGFIVGATGSGKSRVLDAISLALAGAGNTVIWYADGQAGASSPGLADWYDWTAAGEAAITAMLRSACAVLDYRQDENLVEGWNGFTPSAQRPGLLIIIDECHTPLANPVIQAMVARIAREGRKCGVQVVLADQLPTVNVFGPATTDAGNAIRSSILAGNLAALHTTYNGTAGLLPGLAIDPKTLPPVPGYLYLSDRAGDGRSAALRASFVADPKAWADTIPMPQLDTGSATAAGGKYQTRKETRDRARTAAAERVAAMRAGRQPVRPSTPATTTTRQQPAAAPAAESAGAAILPFPTFPPAAPAPAAEQQPTRPSTPAVDRLRINDGQRQVLAAVLAGHTSPGAIQTVTGRSEAGVRGHLQALADAGLVRKPRHGVWEPTEAARAVAS